MSSRNAYLSVFATKSVAKDGKISSIVPMVTHVDHNEHDVDIIVTEIGLADLRGLAPRERAQRIIDHCVAEPYRAMLQAYVAFGFAQHQPIGFGSDVSVFGFWLFDVNGVRSCYRRR